MYWHVFPTKAEAKDAVWRDPNMLFHILPDGLVDHKNEVEMVIYFKNGSVYQLKGADDPDYLRGAGIVGCVLDEFAKMKFEAWQVIEPMLRANGGWCWFIGTPKGRNHLYQMYLRGREGHHEWGSWLLKASESGVIAADQLAEAKRTAHSIEFFNQEYECAFLEGVGSVFRGIQDIATAIAQRPLEGHNYVMGVDLAKVTDYTVITVYDRATNEQVYQDRFNQIDWVYQKKKIKAVSRFYNKCLAVIDGTGLGDPIVDDLQRSGVPVLSYKLSEPSKRDLIEKMGIMIDQRLIKILPIEQTILEFENFSYTMGITGAVRYGAPSGFHDDIVIAHALAVWSLYEHHEQKQTVEPTRTQRALSQAVRRSRNTGAGELDEWGSIE